MINRLRPYISGYLEAAAKPLAEKGVKPIHLSLIGVFASVSSIAPLIGIEGWIGIIGFTILILFSGLMDALDGALARMTGEASSIGSYIDSFLDRVSDTAIIIYLYLGGLTSDALLIMLLLSVSILISYTRAKAESLGVAMSGVGIIERGERVGLVILASLLYIVNPSYSLYLLYLLLVLSIATIIQRSLHVYRALKTS